MSTSRKHKKYEEFGFEDFVADEFFVQWVKSPDENNLHFWEKWLLSNPHKKEVVAEAAGLVRSIDYKENVEFSDDAYIEVFENILKADQEDGHIPEICSTEKSKWYMLLSLRNIAAVFIIGFTSLILFNIPESPKMVEEIAWITKENGGGKKRVVHLNDGTVIHLNSNSTISYPERFTDSLRFVILEKGEAFFDVAKEERRPFVVQVNEAKVAVLGTSFNVNNREGQLEVALVSGKVKVNDNQGNQVVLNPMEMIELEETGHMSKKNFDLMQVTGWKDKYLVFTNDDFNSVVEKIESWYGVKVNATGINRGNWAYTGLYYDESLENVMEGIAQTSRINYEIQGREVYVTK
ncbi:FecR family protein [Algoriphagus resistens]|uniref:FecR family protein n=1 Tax=Algoriphagus resistens TaxID=1750590 RepID=UPI000716931C|nr:FecR family protein [Algoriphagus resistens]